MLQKALAPSPVVFLISDGLRHRNLPSGACSVSIHHSALALLLRFLTHWLSSRHLRPPASPPPTAAAPQPATTVGLSFILPLLRPPVTTGSPAIRPHET